MTTTTNRFVQWNCACMKYAIEREISMCLRQTKRLYKRMMETKKLLRLVWIYPSLLLFRSRWVFPLNQMVWFEPLYQQRTEQKKSYTKRFFILAQAKQRLNEFHWLHSSWLSFDNISVFFPFLFWYFASKRFATMVSVCLKWEKSVKKTVYVRITASEEEKSNAFTLHICLLIHERSVIALYARVEWNCSCCWCSFKAVCSPPSIRNMFDD